MEDNENTEDKKPLRRPGRPGKQWLKSLRIATLDDYQQLVLECVKAFVFRDKKTTRIERTKILIRVPFNLRRKNKDFPRGRVVEEDEYTVLSEYNANQVLDYLYEKGYSSFNSAQIRWSLNSLEKRLDRFNYLLDVAVPLCGVEFLEETIKGDEDV